MEWYLSKIVFEICAGDRPQFDETLRLIQADSDEEAFMKARTLGMSEEDTFVNVHQQTVKWKFIDVCDVIPVDELKDGVELFSQIHEPEESSAYIHYVHQKSALLQMMHSPVL
ncbi:DUF4288 domain-containing protein [uncultured Imperialibacter sp.]|uniref:DUF4288 domain-containing protein n=1 Tax=uncultured Imperialibacter sp. TaxID=1672639 RepID=UPI0030D7BC54|tara:strand:- start:83 stop:421 length:339 start_codon:yes stop_codon:yes gene_type:complete